MRRIKRVRESHPFLAECKKPPFFKGFSTCGKE
jgi:hypothetical protein